MDKVPNLLVKSDNKNFYNNLRKNLYSKIRYYALFRQTLYPYYSL